MEKSKTLLRSMKRGVKGQAAASIDVRSEHPAVSSVCSDSLHHAAEAQYWFSKKKERKKGKKSQSDIDNIKASHSASCKLQLGALCVPAHILRVEGSEWGSGGDIHAYLVLGSIVYWYMGRL